MEYRDSVTRGPRGQRRSRTLGVVTVGAVTYLAFFLNAARTYFSGSGAWGKTCMMPVNFCPNWSSLEYLQQWERQHYGWAAGGYIGLQVMGILCLLIAYIWRKSAFALLASCCYLAALAQCLWSIFDFFGVVTFVDAFFAAALTAAAGLSYRSQEVHNWRERLISQGLVTRRV
ncbi:MAG: hypothetical protein EBS41_00695 [Actinobacteria bacterium]|nr:hypothetical protein [Actinomycetota bacterium]